MSRLPPVAKLPLAVRKNVRDDWDEKKSGIEKNISDILGYEWTINIEPAQIYPYATSAWGKESTGSLIAGYVEGAERRLKEFVNKHGDDGKKEINTACSAHTITMDIDVDKKVDSCCGCQVSTSGELVLLFAEGNLGALTKALNEAPTAPAGEMPYIARMGISADYEGDVDDCKSKIDSLLQTPITLDPNFEEVYARLKADNCQTRDWQENMGNFVRLYMEALASWLKSNKFGEDEILREGLLEQITIGKVVFRIVDKSQMKSSGAECAIENGILHLQTCASGWGSNIDQAANNLMDLL